MSRALALAGAYLLLHGLRRGLRNPAWVVRAARKTLRLARQGGLARFLLHDYLPRHYRCRTKLSLPERSMSVYRKFPWLAADLTFSPHHGVVRGQLTQPPRILVIRHGALGDVLMVTPIVRKLFDDRIGFCRIEVATQHPQVFANSPYVSATIPIKDLPHRFEPFDLVVDLDGVYERNPAAHVIDAYAFHAFGTTAFDKSIDLFPSDADREHIAREIAAIGGPYIVAHKPNHHWPNRNLPVALWVNMLRSVLECNEVRVVQIGSAGDLAVNTDARLLDHRGRYSLQELKLLIAGSAAFVGVDAGPLHLAAATEAPILAFFTSAHHELRQPLRQRGRFIPITPAIECYGCQATNPPPGTSYVCRRGDNECVNRFDAIDAANKVVSIICESLSK